MLAWGYTRLAVARWIHPRLTCRRCSAAKKTPQRHSTKPDALQVLADSLRIQKFTVHSKHTSHRPQEIATHRLPT